VHTPKESPRDKLLQQYVTARITSMSGVDIGLFDYDRHNALYYFALNADDHIYLRYGGRDARGPESYLNLESLERALARGLAEHAAYRRGERAPQPRPEPAFPRDNQLLKEDVIAMGRCVECHLIGDYELLEKELAGELDPLNDLFRYPDIRRLGIELDVPEGLVVAKATGAAAEAGMRTGDEIVALEDTPVLTFGDLQHRYNKVPRRATEVAITVLRDRTAHALTIQLPKEWWHTDLAYRFLTVDPNLFAGFRKLTDDEKRKHGLPEDGFASVVDWVDTGAQVYNLHTLEKGDIIYAVDGVRADDFTNNLEIYIKLEKLAGEPFLLDVIRGGKRMEIRARTYREHFRKPEW